MSDKVHRVLLAFNLIKYILFFFCSIQFEIPEVENNYGIHLIYLGFY